MKRDDEKEKKMSESNEIPALYRLQSVSKVYGGGPTAVYALNGIDLEIGLGEFAVIVGPSGSGKSTLLQLLGGLDRPSAGRLEFEGSDLAAAADAALAEIRLRTIGFVFQQFNLIPTLSAAENVELAIAPTGARRRGAPAAGGGDARSGRPRRSRRAPARPSSPAASSSGSRSPGPSSTSPTSCSPTSRPATSTPPPATRSSACCAISGGRAG